MSAKVEQQGDGPKRRGDEEESTTALRCDAMRRDATRQTKAATPSLLLRAVALAYACYGSAVRARPPTPGSRVYSRARASTATATRSPCWRQQPGARRCRGPRCHSISPPPLPCSPTPEILQATAKYSRPGRRLLSSISKTTEYFFYLFSIIRRLKNSHGRAPRRLYGARRPRHHTIASSGSTEQRPV